MGDRLGTPRNADFLTFLFWLSVFRTLCSLVHTLQHNTNTGFFLSPRFCFSTLFPSGRPPGGPERPGRPSKHSVDSLRRLWASQGGYRGCSWENHVRGLIVNFLQFRGLIRGLSVNFVYISWSYCQLFVVFGLVIFSKFDKTEIMFFSSRPPARGPTRPMQA